MASITLKNLSPALHRQLKSRASRHKRSLNREVIALLEEAVAPSRRVDVEALVAESRAFRQSLKFKISPAEVDKFKREGRA
jgi:plasmid stability protein